MNIPTGPILVVEDNPNVLELIDVTLRFKGYPVVTAKNGLEAMEMISREKPALVIADILMPKMDGYSLAHQLRKNRATQHIPIIFITATYLTPDDKAFAYSLGAASFVEKPIDTDDFLLTVAEILTQGIASLPAPMDDHEFYSGYQQRLEAKLLHKETQIARTERLLQSLPEDQKPAFEALLAQAISDRDLIEEELNDLKKLLGQLQDQQSGKAAGS